VPGNRLVVNVRPDHWSASHPTVHEVLGSRFPGRFFPVIRHRCTVLGKINAIIHWITSILETGCTSIHFAWFVSCT
jgi:hypothetical protein